MKLSNEREAILKNIQEVPDQIKDDSYIEINTTESLSDISTESSIRIQELQTVIKHRELWSKWLLFAVLIIIASELILITLTGFGKTKFQQGDLQLFMGSNIAQIFTLSFIVVKFLFNPSSQKYTTK